MSAGVIPWTGPRPPSAGPLRWRSDAVRCRRLPRCRTEGACTARGWGCTGQGLSVLHEPRTFVEYTRLSASGTPPSCSTRWVTPGRLCAPLQRRDQGSPFSDKTSGDSHARATRSARVSDVMTPEVLRSHETARVDNFWPVRPDPRGVRSFGPGAGPQVRKRALNPQGSSQRVPDDVAVRSLEV